MDTERFFKNTPNPTNILSNERDAEDQGYGDARDEMAPARSGPNPMANTAYMDHYLAQRSVSVTYWENQVAMHEDRL